MIFGLCLLAFLLFMLSGWVPMPEGVSWRHRLFCGGMAALALVGCVMNFPGGK